MNERWIPVVALLRERFAADTDLVEVEAYLSSQGYDGRQIGEILSLLTSDLGPARGRGGVLVPGREPSLRVQGPHERGRFAAEAWGYLVMLQASGTVTINEFEHLVERALVHGDGRISLSDVRAMAEDIGAEVAPIGGERPLLH